MREEFSSPAHLASHCASAPRICILVTACFLLLAGFVLLRRSWILAAAFLARPRGCASALPRQAWNELRSLPNLASTLIESGKLDASAALRWRGRLRGDPLQLPWGTRYEIDLDEVESSAGVTPVTGGLRLTSYQR